MNVPSHRVTLTVIGGGSFFTPSFIGTMCRRPEIFSGAEVRLSDPDAERVRLVKAFCETYTRAKGIPMTFVAAPDLDRALDGADVVITTFRVGGPPALLLDESIPPRFGYYGDETVGPGGMFMAIRTVPVVLDIARRMSRLCPGAWLLNYANPTNFIADALHRSGTTRSASLCDGFICPPNDIGITLLGQETQRIVTRHAGVNHCGWCYSAEFEGRDLLEELRHVDDALVEKNLATLPPEGAVRRRRWLELFRLTGLYPAPAGHMECYFYHDECLQRQLARGAAPHAGVSDRGRSNWDRLKAVLADFRLDAAEQVAKAHRGAHADLAIGVAAALTADTGELYPVNLPHGQALPGFAPHDVLEVYCRVTKRGFEPVRVPAFPRMIHAQQTHLLAVQQLAVQGILEKDRRLLLQALCLHPFTRSVTTARKLFDAMWHEERDILGSYWSGVGA